MKEEIEKERERLLATKGLAEGERNAAQADLEEREEELRLAVDQQQELEKKLSELNSKVGSLPSPLPLLPFSLSCSLLRPLNSSDSGDPRRGKPLGTS